MKQPWVFSRGIVPATALLLSLLASAELRAQAFEQPGTLIWSDEFTASGAPDPGKWNIENWPPAVVNQELQAYTARPENVRVENGTLVIEARRDFYNGNEFSSARIHTAGKMDALYGRVEVRAVLPHIRGTWPAIWAMPTYLVYGAWPTCGEIDIMEHVGYDPGTIHASVHTETYNHSIGTQRTAQIQIPDFNTAYHVYALEWTPTQIKMFVDGVHYFTFANEGTGYREWPFDKPFHVILNIAVGGSWGGLHGVSKTGWPQRMTVDYVRVYSYDFGGDSQPPTAPSSLAGDPSSSSISLSWGPSSDNYAVKEYLVYKDGALQTVTPFQTHVLTGLAENTTYTLAVKARDYSGNESAPISTAVQTRAAVPFPIPGRIEAEAYDAQVGVQTEATTDTGGGINVGWIDAGDWMQYVVTASAAGQWVVDYRIASLSAGGAVQLYDGSGAPLGGVTTLPATGGWQTWTTVSSGFFSLPAGTSVIRVQAAQSGWNLNWLQFRSVDPANDTQPPTAPPNLTGTTTTTTATLTWGTSTDNVAVVGYRVYKDGVLLGTTTGLTTSVTGLTSRTSYVFQVSAYDARNNESVKSQITLRTKSR
jgi:beta-glucanase (GH16 family)